MYGSGERRHFLSVGGHGRSAESHAIALRHRDVSLASFDKLDATACPDTARFLGTAEQTLGALCKDCVSELLRGSRAAAVTG